MTKKQAFIDFVNDLIQNCKHPVEMDENVQFYWNYLNNSDNKETENSIFTDNGKNIMLFLQEHTEKDTWRAKDIAEIMGFSSRAISGGLRKLVNDGFVEKSDKDPVIYAITTKGKEIKIEN